MAYPGPPLESPLQVIQSFSSACDEEMPPGNGWLKSFNVFANPGVRF